MYTALDISTSALVAQRMRLNAIASNIANISTTHNEAGEAVPYQPKFTVFQVDPTIKLAKVPQVSVSRVWKPSNKTTLEISTWAS